jgi:hypothetical protein
MHKLALVITALSMVVAASVVNPLRASAATSTPAICDAGFHFVSSPNAFGINQLRATAAISANDIWAVGDSNVQGTPSRALIEHWNGATWTIFPTPQPGGNNVDLNGVAAIASNNVWAVGDYELDPTGTHIKTFAEHWNGATWTLDLTTPNPNPTFSLLSGAAADPSGNVWAVGTYDSAGLFPLIEKFNGTSWSQSASPNPSPSDNQLFAVSAFSSTDAWAVGEVSGVGGMGATPRQSFAQHWDGSNWTTIATPNLGGSGASNEIFAVNALEAGHAVGVGYGNFVVASTPQEGEAWDLLASGTSTNAAETGPGAGDNALEAVARSGAGVWAVGYGRNTPSGAAQSLVVPATWDGTTHTLTWSAIGTSDNPGPYSFLDGVVAVSPYSFWAVGSTDYTLTESYCARHFSLSARPSTAGGVPFTVTVTTKNGDGTIATGYGGTVHFTSSDGSATLPADYMFVPGDNGVHIFNGVVLRTGGSQTITVADIAMPLTMPATATVLVCIGVCQAPAGAPGSRNTNPGPTGSPGARNGANQSGSGAPGPRLPRTRLSSQGSVMSPSTAPAATTGQGTHVVAAPPAAASKSAQSAPSAGGAVAPGPRSTSVQAPAEADVSLVARKVVVRPPDQTPWFVLLVPLIACAPALIAARRPRSKGMRR